MPEIHLLDAVTIGQIAAGEVIERPLSVVKELVENAVDSGARRIAVSIEKGGVEGIEVADDGIGISPEQLPFAVQRHATSKLAIPEDLESIDTLGFRGEGLASIAAVSHLTIISRPPTAEIGAKITAHADNVSPVGPIGAPVGTRVRAEHLFENVPVRREYLRAASAEFNRISSWLSTFALAYPHVTFALRHDGKETWTLPGTDDVQQRLAMVFGRNAVENLIPLQTEATSSLTGTLRGFISSPGTDRPDRRMQVLFVNRRLLRSTLLAGAWTAGYSTFAMIGRHPYGVLFLDVPPDHVDPNVHPTKSDVRLRYGTQTFDATRRAITATLQNHATQRFTEQTKASPISLLSTDFGKERLENGIRWQNVGTTTGATDGGKEEAVERERSPEGGTNSGSANGYLFQTFPHTSPPSHLRVLTQINNTYILTTDGSSLVLFDQHAAHERIAYEQIVNRAKNEAPSEPLLVPLIIELDPAASAALEQTITTLHEAGLEIEPFGERTYRITATPAGYGARPFDLRGFLDDLSEDPKQRGVHERIWASLACHSVTIAGERLELEEMQTLVERLQHCNNPMHCPHGRPTLVRLDPDALGRLFKRQ